MNNGITLQKSNFVPPHLSCNNAARQTPADADTDGPPDALMFTIRFVQDMLTQQPTDVRRTPSKLNMLADMYFLGRGCVNQNPLAALHWYLEAVNSPHPEPEYMGAELRIGCLYTYYEKEGIKPDINKALPWFQKAADKGDAKAKYELGLCYYHGKGVPQNFEKSFDCFLVAAKSGLDAAQCTIGNMYFHGKGVEQNHKDAFKWFGRAAEQKNATAKFMQANMVFSGYPGVSKNEARAFKWYLEAAIMGHADAQYIVGILSLNGGPNIKKNKEAACRWFKEASEQNHVDAKCQLATLYLEGKVVPKDLVMAMTLLEESANLGDLSALLLLGNVYLSGADGFPKNFTKAREYFEKAAEQQSGEAAFQLSVIHAQGLGVEPDTVQGYKWFQQAVDLNQPDAVRKMSEMDVAARKLHQELHGSDF